MKLFLMKTLMITSTILPTMINPVSMGLLLIMQTAILTILMNKMIMSSWFTMITFLMMIGGLLILFTYMSSIASNEKFKFNLKLLMPMIILIIITDELMIEIQIKENQSIINNKMFDQMSMTKLYNYKSMLMTIILVMYLLLTMIIVSKMVKHFNGPLRSKNYE
nr:NADH dehydrogenase subunit 6 [Ujna puerana]